MILQLDSSASCLPCRRSAAAALARVLQYKARPRCTQLEQRLDRKIRECLSRHQQTRSIVTQMAVADAAQAEQSQEKNAVDFAVALATIADDTKCEDISLLHVAPLVSWTSYMLIVSVFSKPQLLACIARMEKAAEETWQRTKQNQPGSSPWEVLDYGDVVVHVFTPEQREYYDVESFYAAAEEVELPLQSAQQAQGGQWSTRPQ